MARLPTYDAWVKAWMPRDTLTERALRDQTPYDVWVRDGWLNAEAGRTIRLDFVATQIAELAIEYEIAELPMTAMPIASSRMSSTRSD